MKQMKGQLLNEGAGFVFGILFIAILLGVGVIATGAMQVSLPVGNQGAAQNISYIAAGATAGNASVGTANFSAQLPTIGTEALWASPSIAGVGLIIAVLFIAIGTYVLGRK